MHHLFRLILIIAAHLSSQRNAQAAKMLKRIQTHYAHSRAGPIAADRRE